MANIYFDSTFTSFKLCDSIDDNADIRLTPFRLNSGVEGDVILVGSKAELLEWAEKFTAFVKENVK